MLSEDFSKFLKKKGKKDHVVQSLVDSIKEFEKYLKKEKITLENLSPNILTDYINYIESNKKINVKNRLRAISLYYLFIKNSGLVKLASRLREQRISKTRSSAGLKDFRGVNQNYIDILAGFGIKSTEQMLKNTALPAQRTKLARKTGIPLKAIIEFVKLSDLSRIRGIKGIRARLFYDAGFDTIEKLVMCDPHKLQKKLEKFVEETGFDGIAPLSKEIVCTIEQAKKIKKIVKY